MTSTATTRTPQRAGFLHALEGRPAFGNVGPNWFASVMGTGIIANAAATLPVDLPGLLPFARVVWSLDVILLLVVLLATGLHWIQHPRAARSHLDHPVMSHFYGAPAMGLMTVGAGALLVGVDVIGLRAALAMDFALWTTGTLLGLWTAAAIPYRTFLRDDVGSDAAFGGWLMPVVPPMVSAATGALLIPHLPEGQARLTLEMACYAMFGLALLSSIVVITLVWGRLARHGIGAAAAVPTLWIVLGPLGQSITAAHNLGEQPVLAAPYAGALKAFGVVYGLPVWGFAMLWLAIAVTITARTVRREMPFSLTWWSFTFPVGTVVTGTSALSDATGADVFTIAAVTLFAALVVAWAIVATRTARGVWTGQLLR